MKKNVFVFMILGACVTMPVMADYPIGTFIAPKGADGINGTNGTNGTDCRPTETRTRCYGTGSSKCDDSTRSGVKIVTTQCDGSGPTTSYIYDNNCGITVASTTDVHQDNDATKPITHKRVTFKNTCTDETLSTTADVPVGCTPTYTQKYINKETNGTYSYNNSSRSENTVGARVTVSGCGNDNSFDTYDGNDGTSFNFKGKKDTCDELYAITGAQQNDAWLVAEDGLLYIYNGTNFPSCPNGGAAFTGPAGDNNCTGYEDSNTAVKHTLRTYSGPSNSTESSGVTFYATRGKMVLTHKMCNTGLDDTVDNENDPCVPIIAPSGVACNGTYFECKPQGTYPGNTNYAKYNVCEATTGTTFSSALSNKEDAVCVGTNANSSSVEREKTVSYTAPTGSGGYGTYSWKTAVGKVVNKSVKCNNSETTISSTPDKCEEIVKPNGVCTDTNKVYYKCTQQNNGTEYNLCASGNSVLGAVETAVAAVDPCADLSEETAKVARTKSVSRSYSGNGSTRDSVSFATVTRNTCSTTTPTQTTYEYDTCKEIAPTSNCTGNTKAYLECRDQVTKSTYNVCQTVTANTSLTSKINGKADASAVTQSALANTLGSTYLKPSELGTAVTNAIETEINNGSTGAFKDFVTNGTLDGYVKTDGTNLPSGVITTTNLGNQLQTGGALASVVTNDTLKQNLLNANVMGTCTTSSGTGDNAPTTTCTTGSLMAEIYNQLKNAIDAAGKN